MKKYIVLALTLFIIGVPVHAQTSIPVYSYTTSSLTTSGQFNTDLSLGSRGEEVSTLQTWLIGRGFDIPSVTSGATAKGYYGQQTKNAVAAYQRSVGLEATGFWGPSTRALANGGSTYPQPTPTYYPYPTVYPTPYPTVYPYPQPGNYAPVINSIDAPSTLRAGETGTWTVRATDRSYGNYYGNLTYSVDWGDTYNAPQNSYVGVPSTASFTQNATFTHAYNNPGNYTVRFTVRNSSGQIAQSTVTVVVQGSIIGNLPDINIVSPNGGERWLPGTTQTITVNVTGDASRIGDRVSTYLVDQYNNQTRLQEFAILPSGNYPGIKSYTVSIPSSLPAGTYRILVNLYRYTGMAPEHQAYDYSNGYITISSFPNYGNPWTCPSGYVCQPAY